MRLFLKIFIVLNSMLVFTFSINASVDVRIVNNSAFVGDTVLVAINTTTIVTDSSIFAYQFELNYSGNYLKPVGVENVGTITESWGAPQWNISSANRVKLTAAGGSPLSGSGNIVFVRFRLLVAGNVSVSFADTDFNMLNEGDPLLVLTSGRVNISSRPSIRISPDQGTVAVGETLQFYSSNGTTPYVYSVTDPTVASVSATGMLTGLKRGKVYVVSEDQNGVVDSTNNPIEIVPFKITIRDSSYYQNQWVDIPVNVSSLDIEQVYSGNITIGYNSAILLAERVIITDAILENTAVVEANLNRPGQVIVSFASDQVLTGGGVLFYIRFRVADRTNGASQLNISDVIFNENLYAVYDNGYFSITPLPSLDVSPATGTLFTSETLEFNVSGGTAPYSWSVSNPAYADINENGLLTALSGGDVRVSVHDFFGSEGHSNTISIYDGQLIIDDVETPEDDTNVEIPVMVTGLNQGMEVISLSGLVNVNLAKIQQYSLSTSGSLSETWATAFHMNNEGFQFAMAGTNSTMGDGVLLYLDAELAAGAVSGNVIPVVINDVVANEGSPRLLVDQGSITITPATGINEKQSRRVVIYPNPANNYLWYTSPKYLLKVNIYGITGEVVNSQLFESQQKEGMLNVSKIYPGIYIFEFKDVDGRYTYQKLKIER